jgi:ubiquinone/menaquinone biosynthesis C-methylase UbiE
MTEEPCAKALLDALPVPSRALDVATGTGRWALHLAKLGATVTAIDGSPEMLAVASEKAQAEDLSITFHLGDLEEGLPFPSARFDFVVCALALSHVPDLRGAVAECSRVLCEGGHLLITDFHPQAIKNGWKATVFQGENAYVLPHPEHERSDYLKAIAASGSEILHVEDILVREQPPESIMAEDLDRFLEQYGDWPFCLIVLSRRRRAAGKMDPPLLINGRAF